MKKKMKALISLFVLSLVLLTACGGGSAAATPAGARRLQKVIDSGVVRVATIPDNPGWSVLKADGTWEGYDIDIANKFGEALDVKVEFISTDGAGRIPMITSDKCDIVISGIVPTNERAKSVTFTNPYTGSGILGLTHADAQLNSWDELAGKKVSVARGTTSDVFVTGNYPDAEVVRFDSIADAFMALKTKKVDVLLEANSQINALVAENPDLTPMNVDMARASYACMAVAQGDQDWVNYVNNFINNNLYDGTFQELYEKHFDMEMPKLNNF